MQLRRFRGMDSMYKITYVRGFEDAGFAYFLAVQRRRYAFGDTVASRLVRVCQKDFRTYTEVHLQCGNGTDYGVAQVKHYPGAYCMCAF